MRPLGLRAGVEMGQVTEQLSRLEQALARLEQSAHGLQTRHADAQRAALRAPQAADAQALAVRGPAPAPADHEPLLDDATTRAIAARVDHAIGRLEALLNPV